MNILEQKGFYLDEWWVAPAEGRLIRADQTIRLEPKAMEVLVYLASRRGEVVSREELEMDVWRGALVGYDAITGTVIKLRKALGDDAKQPRYITTIPKRGYQLIAPVTFSETDSTAVTPSVEPLDPSPSGFQDAAPVKVPVEQASQAQAVIWRGAGLLILIAVIIFSVIQFWPQEKPSPASVVSEREAAGGIPSVIVLPFDYLGENTEQSFLSDGITDDIITDLSQSSSLLVIASNTSFAYKDKFQSPQEVGKELNVDYVLQGSIRPVADSMRINVQLMDIKTGFNAWGERYDRKQAELFSVQDEITNSVIKALSIELTSQEKQRLAQKATSNLKAYTFFQEGQRFLSLRTRDGNQQARDAYQKAIDIDPSYGRAYGSMAVSLTRDYRRGWTDTPQETMARALSLAKHAVALDSSVPQTYWALGYVHLIRKEYDMAENAINQAIAIAPNFADGYSLLAYVNNSLGNGEKAVELTTRAIQLNPHYSFGYPFNLGQAYYILGQYDKAVTALEEAYERNPNAMPIKLCLVASYVSAGRLSDAEWLASEIQMTNPAMTVTAAGITMPLAENEHRRAFLADLRKAGLPE